MTNRMYLTYYQKRRRCILEEQLKTIKTLHEIQGSDGNWNHDPYMMGMYNGMELLLAILEARDPVYKETPDVWGKDLS